MASLLLPTGVSAAVALVFVLLSRQSSRLHLGPRVEPPLRSQVHGKNQTVGSSIAADLDKRGFVLEDRQVLKGIFINCGGKDVADSSRTTTWQADSYANAGTTLCATNSIDVDTPGTHVNSSVFQCKRVFGGKGPSMSSYSIPVDAVGYYIVRLYFHHAPTSVSAPIFTVRIEGVPALYNYKISGHGQGQVEEFFVPITDRMVDISFIRGPVGDPMVSAIAVIPAPAGMYGLDVASGLTLRTEHRLACGSTETVVDSLGRVWTGDMFSGSFWPPDLYSGLETLPEADPTRKDGAFFAAAPYHSFNVSKSWEGELSLDPFLGMRKNLDVAPELLPPEVFQTSRWTDVSRVSFAPEGNFMLRGPFMSLNYTFTVEPNTEHMVRLGWAYVSLAAPDSMVVNVSIDNVDKLTGYDLWLAKEYNGPAMQSVFATSNPSGKMQVSIYPSSNETWYRDVMLTSIEVFRINTFEGVDLLPVEGRRKFKCTTLGGKFAAKVRN